MKHLLTAFAFALTVAALVSPSSPAAPSGGRGEVGASELVSGPKTPQHLKIFRTPERRHIAA